jgi:tripartite motif-containing protein 71
VNRRAFLRVSGQGLGLLCLSPLGSGCASDKSAAPSRSGGFDPGPYRVGEEHVVFDGNSSAFILDGDEHAILDLDDSHRVEGRFASLGDGAGELNHPVAATVHGDRLLVLDRGNGRVQIFDHAGNLQGVIGDDLHLPRGLAAHGDRVYVCDTMRHTVRVFRLDGAELASIGSGDQGEGLNAPVGVAVDARGDLHVLDSGNARVQVFSSDGQALRSYGGYGHGDGQMQFPGSLVIAPDGRIFISDVSAGFVHVFRQDGAFLGRFQPVDERGERVAPVRVQLQHDGGLYIWTDGHRAT